MFLLTVTAVVLLTVVIVVLLTVAVVSLLSVAGGLAELLQAVVLLTVLL